jgi:hypothetical protein
MKRTCVSAAVIASLSLAIGLVAPDAGAAYSGYVYRTECPNGAFQVTWDQNVDTEGGWAANGLCGVYVFGVGVPYQYMPGTLNIPYESQVANNSAEAWLFVYAAQANGVNGIGQIKAESYAVDQWGNLTSGSGEVKTSGVNMNNQWMGMPVYVPTIGTVVTSVSGQAETIINQSMLVYTSNGT